MLAIRSRFNDTSMSFNTTIHTILRFYRYGSLLVASLFYLLGPPYSPSIFKLGVILCLFIESVVFYQLHDNPGSKESEKKGLLVIETMGLAGVLFLTGGLDSPYLWYVINPILLATLWNPPYFCWLLLGLFTSIALLLQPYSLFRGSDFGHLWSNRLPIMLALTSATLGAQLYHRLLKKITLQAKLMQQHIEHIDALHEAMDVFTRSNNPQEIVNLFSAYSKKLVSADKVVIWIELDETLGRKSYYAVRGPSKVVQEEDWYPHVLQAHIKNKAGQETGISDMKERKSGRHYTSINVAVRSRSRLMGTIVAFYHRPQKEVEDEVKPLLLLGKLCGEALEKYTLEVIADEFRIVDEKDRIAAEIHDSVSQNLFGLVYGLETIILSDRIDEDLRNQIRILQKRTQVSLRDLRRSIYELSTVKNNREPFEMEVKKFLRDLGVTNRVQIEHEDKVAPGALNGMLKNTLFRILREAAGNAVKHSQCSMIEVNMSLDNETVELTVTDNGSGFDVEKVFRQKKYGLGLVNMKELSRSVSGKLTIESSRGNGTKVLCRVPVSVDCPVKDKEGMYYENCGN